MGYNTSRGFPRKGKSWPISLQNSRSPTLARIVKAGGLSALMGQAVRLGFDASNNESEYEAIIAGIELALVVGVDGLLIHNDSQLIVGQIKAEFESREPRMAKYASLAKQKLSTLAT